MYGENSATSGDMYQISNKQTLGITEKEIIENMQVIVEKIIKQERKARKILADKSLDLEDEIYRNYGILSNCKKISSEETRNIIVRYKIGSGFRNS